MILLWKFSLEVWTRFRIHSLFTSIFCKHNHIPALPCATSCMLNVVVFPITFISAACTLQALDSKIKLHILQLLKRVFYIYMNIRDKTNTRLPRAVQSHWLFYYIIWPFQNKVDYRKNTWQPSQQWRKRHSSYLSFETRFTETLGLVSVSLQFLLLKSLGLRIVSLFIFPEVSGLFSSQNNWNTENCLVMYSSRSWD